MRLDTSLAESTILQRKKWKTQPEYQELQVFPCLPRKSAAPVSAQRAEDDLRLTAFLASPQHHTLFSPQPAPTVLPLCLPVARKPLPEGVYGVNLDEKISFNMG